MAEVEMAKVVFANGKEFPITEAKAKKLVTQELFGVTKKAKKTSVNGAEVGIDGYAVKKLDDNKVKVSHPDHKSRTFELDNATLGCELVAKEAWQLKANGEINKNAKTGTRFVELPSGSPFGENLVKPLIEAGILNQE